MMKTEQASKEVASANMAQENAARALRKAEEAQMVVDKQAAEHDRVRLYTQFPHARNWGLGGWADDGLAGCQN